LPVLILPRRRGPPPFPCTTLFRSALVQEETPLGVEDHQAALQAIEAEPSAPREPRHEGRADAGHRAPSVGPRSMASSIAHKIWSSEEHTSELQSRENLVCRLLLEN